MIYLLDKLHTHSSNILLLIVVKLKTIEIFLTRSTSVGYFSKSITINHFRITNHMALELLGSVELLPL
jgi:hypothetical protein